MPDEFRGFPSIYFDTLRDFYGQGFYEWKLTPNNVLEVGQVCETVVRYNKDKNYELVVCDPNPHDEPKTKFQLAELDTRLPYREQRLQHFNLEMNERLVVTRGKLRKCIIMAKNEDDWWNPGNAARIENNWIVLPLYTYKPRHGQDYVLNDQALRTANRFYIPPTSPQIVRVGEESAAKFDDIQEVSESDIKPVNALHPELQMQKGIKLNSNVLRLVHYHYFKWQRILRDFERGMDDEYQIFRDAVRELIDAAKQKSGR